MKVECISSKASIKLYKLCCFRSSCPLDCMVYSVYFVRCLTYCNFIQKMVYIHKLHNSAVLIHRHLLLWYYHFHLLCVSIFQIHDSHEWPETDNDTNRRTHTFFLILLRLVFFLFSIISSSSSSSFYRYISFWKHSKCTKAKRQPLDVICRLKKFLLACVCVCVHVLFSIIFNFSPSLIFMSNVDVPGGEMGVGRW